MTKDHEGELIDLDELLISWPVAAVPRHRVPEAAHHHAVEFKKQSGASPEQISELMARHNDGADLDRYFERRVEAISLDPAADSANRNR